MVEPVRFPDIELYRGWGEPLRTECDIRGLELTQGEIPDGLEGALYKVGADRQYPSGRTDDIFIDGEGMIRMFRFKDNQVDYVSRWVHTERYKLQKAAKRRAVWALSQPLYQRSERGWRSHGHRQYDGDVPRRPSLRAEGRRSAASSRSRRRSIRSGRDDFDGAVRAMCLSAHPKVDPGAPTSSSPSPIRRSGDATRDIVFYRFGPGSQAAERDLVRDAVRGVRARFRNHG